MQKHQNEAGENREARKPSKNVRPLFFRVIYRGAIREKFAEQKACGQSAAVRPVVDSYSPENSERKQEHQRANQTRPQVAHIRAAAFCRNREDPLAPREKWKRSALKRKPTAPVTV